MTIIPNRALIDGQTCKIGDKLYVAVNDLWQYDVNFFEQYDFDTALKYSVQRAQVRLSLNIERYVNNQTFKGQKEWFQKNFGKC